MTGYKTPPPTRISPDSPVSIEELQGAPIVVLCGRNNSGKTFVLRELAKLHGQSASYLGPARFSNFTALGAFGPESNYRTQKYKQLYDMLRKEGQNVDNSPFNLQQAIAAMSNERRARLMELINELLGVRAKICPTIPDNEMAQRYFSVDGHNLSFTSSGFRLITTLLASFLDNDYTVFLVDEPELGLSPEIQGTFADFLLDDDNRRQYFPHMAQIVLATHSPIFLDRTNIQNNFVVERYGRDICVRRIESLQDLNSLQFLLLGNRFETLFLPSAIILVEGKTDHAYVSRLLAQRYPKSLLSVIRCDGDGRLRQVLNIATQMLTDLRRSPYAERIFAVMDAVHGTGLKKQLMDSGVLENNVIIWDKNGIEYLYPRDILKERFGAFEEIQIEGENVGANGVWVKKAELCEFVLSRLNAQYDFPEEIQEKLFARLDTMLF